MISIVLYGRNDSYGYNLHKRAALGLNTMAEVLTDPDDEILFVDYNTPDDYPTFPEAIADTLTDAAAARLRVLRARPALHARFQGRTHLLALEPIARNIAVRRSNPANRWVLSTNTDMIFVPRTEASLSEIAADLPEGFYHLPRFELPESLWEGFDRRDPAGVIDRVRELGRRMFLNEIVFGAEFNKYDGPGDLQLMLRRDLFRMHAFNEEMLLGWHVDSNIAKRLHLMYGRVGDVVDRLFGYHCDHTRQVTPAHRHRAASNDSRVFVETVADPSVPAQAETWGCPGDEIEEVRLARSAHHVYLDGLRAVLTGEWAEPPQASYTSESFNLVTYDPRHVLPFLADLFSSAPRHWTAAWVGGRLDTFRLFCGMWDRLGFEGRVLMPEWCSLLLAPGAGVQVDVAGPAELASNADVVVIDFGIPSHAPPDAGHRADPRVDRAVDALARRSFSELVAAERVRLAAHATPRRFVCVNAVHNGYETIVLNEIAAPLTPFASRMRQGFVKPNPEGYADEAGSEPGRAAAPNLLAVMQVGEAGVRGARGVRAPFGRRGVVVHGPHRPLPRGTYQVDLSVGPLGPATLLALARPIIVDVAAGTSRLVQHRFRFLLRGTLRITFVVTDEIALDRPIYLTVFRGRWVDFVVTDVTLTRLADPDGPRDDLSWELKRLLGAHTESPRAAS
jgi:hypothetical protein